MNHKLQHRQIGGGEYKLTLTNTDWWHGKDSSRRGVAYTLRDPQGEIIFKSDDFGVPWDEKPTGIETMKSLMKFLTLELGDVNVDYFKDYTPRQIAFRDNEAEFLSQYADEDWKPPHLIAYRSALCWIVVDLNVKIRARNLDTHACYIASITPGGFEARFGMATHANHESENGHLCLKLLDYDDRIKPSFVLVERVKLSKVPPDVVAAARSER